MKATGFMRYEQIFFHQLDPAKSASGSGTHESAREREVDAHVSLLTRALDSLMPLSGPFQSPLLQ